MNQKLTPFSRVCFSTAEASGGIATTRNHPVSTSMLRRASALLLACIVGIFVALPSMAQVTTNSGSGLAASYPSLADVITALNAATISSPVTITLSGDETAPAGGYSITATGDASNTIIIEGSSSTLTASAAHTAGAINDAIIKIIGGDYITIRNFNMQENASNTVNTPAASNTMTEFGVVLFYASATNGSQNITIHNNTISLNRTYTNTFGIYANSTHTATSMTAAASATGSTGGTSNLSITANTISNVNQGIVIIGPLAAADQNTNVVIGGSAGNANTISNFGTAAHLSSFVNVSGTMNGILIRNTAGYTISHNTFTSSSGGVTSGTLRAIFNPANSSASTGTFTNNVNNNTIALEGGAASVILQGINLEGSTASVTSSLNINNNNFTKFDHTSATSSGAITGIINVGTHLNININSNTFTDLTCKTTGNFTFISNSLTLPAGGVKNVNNNSIVTAFSKTGAGGTVALFTDNGSDPSGTTNNLNNNNFSNITITGATILNGLANTNGGSPTKNVNGNTLSNWTCGNSAVTAISINFDGGTSTVSNNNINNISAGAAVTCIAFGTSGAGTTNASGNTIHTITSSGASAVTGISIGGGSTGTRNIFKNKVYGLSSTSASTGTVLGMTLSSGANINVYNNFIGNLTANTATGNDVIRGINITSATATSNVNVSFNTIFINASSSGTNFGTTGIFHTTSTTATTASLSLRNNIVVNNSTANGTGLVVAFRRSSGAANNLNNYNSVSNNNLFFAGTPSATNLIYSDGTSSAQTMSAYRTGVFTAGTIAPRDAVSFSENPTFQSTTGSSADFLKIDLSIATQIESGGVAITGITDDYFGTTRNTISPDLGAFEGNMTGLDLMPPSISYTAFSNTPSTSDRTLTATITDATGVPTSGIGLPVLYWNINNGTYNSATGVHQSGSSYNFTFGNGVNVGDTVKYFIVAQDMATAKNVAVFPSTGASGLSSDPPAASTPPTSPSRYTIIGSISGTISVGIGQTFTTLTGNNAAGLFRALNDSLAISGNIEIEITSDITETGAVALNQIVESGTGNYTVTIKPDASVLRNLTGTNASALIRFNGADRIIIDGRHSGSGSFLRFANSNTGTSSSTIWFNSISGNGATNNTVRNCIIEGNGSLTTLAALLVSGSSAGGVAETANSNFNALNNTLRRAQYGIAVVGPTGNESGLVISGNTVGSTVLAEKIGFRGIAIFQQNGASIRENTIVGVSRSTGDNNAAGLAILGTQTGTVVSRNIISDIRNTNTAGWGAQGIHLASSTFGNGVIVSNNVVSDVSAQGWPSNWTDNAHGIHISNGGGYSLHFNTVNLTTNQTVNGNTAALYISSASVTGLSISNNIFSNAQTNSSRRAVYSLANDTSFTVMNHNLYRADTIGFIGATTRVNLAAWQTGTGKDVNSISGDPLFTSSTNLRPLFGSPVFGTGSAVAGITVDFLGNTRSVSTPSIGAYETALINTWTGTGSWTTGANWSLGAPASGDNVLIGSGTVEATAGATINNITVNSGATVTIPNATSLTVNGALTNNGTFTVQNGGHLLQDASATIGGSGTFNATRNSGNTSNLVYNMWSSPNSISTLSNLGGTDWYFFNETSQAWSNTGLTGSSVMSAGRGYSSTGAGNVTFTGTFNNGTVSPEIGTSGQGWNLVGNPYPSSVSGTSFLAGNTNIDGTLWFWSQPTAATVGNIGGDYATWTTAGGTAGTAGGATPDGNIGLAQGFFVKANSGTTVSFTNSMRSANAGSNFRLGGERAWFNLIGGNNLFNQILLGFSSGASDQRDPADGTKLKGNTQIAFYSLLGTEHLAIQAMAERGTATRIVPVGFDVATAGAYSLALDRTENMPANVDIFLKDKLTGHMHNLRNQAYGFAVTNPGSFTNRFEIHFGVGLVTSVNNLAGSENVRIYGAGQTLFVQGFAEGTLVERFEVRDAAGRLIMELNRPQAADLARMEMNVAAGVYLARIVTNNGIKTERVYLSK